MKKVLLVAVTLLIVSVVYADKKCCKDKASCKKEACKKGEAKAGCCKNKHAETSATMVQPDGTLTPATTQEGTAMKACCKNAAAHGKSCCQKNKSEMKAAPQGADVK